MRKTPTITYKGKKEYGIFFASDLHSDDADFNQKRFIQDIERNIEKENRILLGGDNFSLILPKDMKRFTGSRAKKKQDRMIDAYVNDAIYGAFELLKPYVDHIDAIGVGNHESSVVKFNGTDAVQFLVMLLNKERNDKLPPIVQLGYKGFITIQVERFDRLNNVVVWYDHGRGGGAAVTKGMIDMNRTLAAVEGADILWLQHKHVRWADVGIGRYYPKKNGDPAIRKIIGMITGCYQEEVSNDGDYPGGYIINFGEERMTAPQGVGGIGIKIIPYDVKENGVRTHEIDYEVNIRR